MLENKCSDLSCVCVRVRVRAYVYVCAHTCNHLKNGVSLEGLQTDSLSRAHTYFSSPSQHSWEA